jgi:hypothetical protein
MVFLPFGVKLISSLAYEAADLPSTAYRTHLEELARPASLASCAVITSTCLLFLPLVLARA